MTTTTTTAGGITLAQNGAAQVPVDAGDLDDLDAPQREPHVDVKLVAAGLDVLAEEKRHASELRGRDRLTSSCPRAGRSWIT